MKKSKKFLSLLVCLMLLPMLTVHAQDPIVKDQFVVEADDTVTSKDDVNGSGIYAGNNVNFENTIDGIGVLAGNNVDFKGNAEYGVLAGNNINVNGNIEKEGFIFGNIIHLDDNFVGNRDLFIFGNTVTIDGTVKRDVTIYAAEVIIKGKVERNVTISADKIEVSGDAIIGGTLKYNEDAKANISSNATIQTTEVTEALVREYTWQQKAWSFIQNYVGMLLIFLVAGLLIPALFRRYDTVTKTLNPVHALAMAGYGIISMLFVPMLSILLIATTFGVSLGLLLLALFIIACCLATIFTGYLLGLVIWRNFIKKDINVLLVGFIGITILMLLQLIPYIGTVIAFISMIIGVGSIIYLFRKAE